MSERCGYCVKQSKTRYCKVVTNLRLTTAKSKSFYMAERFKPDPKKPLEIPEELQNHFLDNHKSLRWENGVLVPDLRSPSGRKIRLIGNPQDFPPQED